MGDDLGCWYFTRTSNWYDGSLTLSPVPSSQNVKLIWSKNITWSFVLFVQDCNVGYKDYVGRCSLIEIKSFLHFYRLWRVKQWTVIAIYISQSSVLSLIYYSFKMWYFITKCSHCLPLSHVLNYDVQEFITNSNNHRNVYFYHALLYVTWLEIAPVLHKGFCVSIFSSAWSSNNNVKQKTVIMNVLQSLWSNVEIKNPSYCAEGAYVTSLACSCTLARLSYQHRTQHQFSTFN